MAAGCMMTDAETIDIQNLPEHLSAHGNSLQDFDRMVTIAEMELRHAGHVLKYVSGNRARAAEILGISRATLYRLLTRLQQER